MPASRIKQRLTNLIPVLKVWLLCAVGLAALGTLYYFLATLGPKRVGDPSAAITAPDDPAVARLSEEITALEKKYRQAADAQMATEESTEALELAVEKQRELLRTFTRAGLDQSARLTRLETELDSVRAREKVQLVDRLARDGEELLARGEVDGAGEKLREALRLQREVNTSSAGSRYKNYVRETSLTQAVAAVEAAPLHKEMEAALAKARDAAAGQRWGEALSAYIAARDAQARINREYPRTRYADLMNADRLTAEIQSLEASGVAGDIEAKERSGDAALARRAFEEAAAAFAAAEELQLQINKNYPRSRFVSSQRIEDLAVKRQTALSTPLADELEELDRAISRHLSRRQVVAADQKLGDAGALVEKLFSTYPKSQRLNGGLRIKLAYLALRRGELRALQDEVYERLLPLPGVAERLLLRTEVPQSLYVLVMNTNPSRNPGRTLPVDSVSWNDAREFCTRLSWLLGTTVRLPSQDEIRVALGGDDGGQAWSSDNSEGRSRDIGALKPNPFGFHDLLGNLAEWVDADVNADKANIVGGSYLDKPATLTRIPAESMAKSDRARHVGMRVLVEL